MIKTIKKWMGILYPIAIYNVVDNYYHVTPRLTIYFMELIDLCLNLLSLVILTLHRLI